MAKNVVCPYCWHSSRAADLEYHCGDACNPREFFVSPKGAPTACPHGQRPLPRRHCPQCSRPLLREYIDVDGKSLAVIGTAGSGKTTYVGVLLHELRHRVAVDFGNMALDLLGDDSRRNFDERLHRPLYERNEQVRKTVVLRASAELEPIIFTLKMRTSAGLLRRNDLKTVLSVFYDTAGENLERAEALDVLGRHLSAAEGIILLIDPLQMRRVRETYFPDVAAPAVPADQHSVVARLGELLAELRPKAGRVRTPLAVVLTKFDALQGSFPEDSPLRRVPRHRGSYDDVDGRDVHEEVKAWLHEWFGAHLDASLEANFAEYRYFAMSALGAAPVNGELAPSGINPYRVEDPMLWFLARSGLIKNGSGAR